MKKVVHFNFFLFFFSFICFGQTGTYEPTSINKLDTSFFIRDNVSYYLDSTRSLSFEEIKKISFKKSNKPLLDYQSKTWYKFHVKPEIKSKVLIFSPSHADSSNFYVPQKGGYYKKFLLGQLTDKHIEFSIFEASILYVPTDSIDFSKPFYYDKVILTKSGELNADNSGYLALANDVNIWKKKRKEAIGYTKSEHVFIAVLLIAMLIFLVNYFVTKDRNFLNYSLYLLFTIFIYLNHLSGIVNFLNGIHPLFLRSLSHLSVIMASISYFYFVIYFLDVKKEYPKIYPLTYYTIIGSLILAVFSVIQLAFFPYLKYRFDILKTYDILFVIISVSVFIYLISQRLTLIKRIIIFGSLLLIIGQILSIITGNTYYFIGAVILEIIVFSGVVSVQNKITTRLKTASDTALKNEKIERENLLQIDNLKSRFITNITHEFRTPLTIILGYVQSLKEQFTSEKSVNTSLETIEQNSNNLLNLVNQMLDLAKIEQGQLTVNMVQTDMVSYLQFLMNSFSNLAVEKSIKLEFESKEKEFLMDLDIEKTRQIISNLISNAIKFSNENTKILVSLKQIDSIAEIKVIDQGFGISESELPHVFDRFFQVENQEYKIPQGTGIGLAVTKELVNLLQGTISVSSKENIGTKFILNLPVNNNAELTNETFKNFKSSIGKTYVPQLDAVITPEDTNTILIVEDNLDMARYIASCLQTNYKVLFANDGQTGFEKAQKEIPDIIITDLMMPKMDGHELTQKLQKNLTTNHIPIIMLTSKATQEDRIEGINSGTDVYLTKPFHKQELLLRIQMLISKRKKLQEFYSLEKITKESIENRSDKNLVFLNNIIELIHKNIEDSNFNAKQLSKEMSMSDSQLYRKLKAISNSSTSIFIRKVRLKKAKEFLISKDFTVSEVAYATGFNDPKWFSKAFKEEFKQNPSDLIK